MVKCRSYYITILIDFILLWYSFQVNQRPYRFALDGLTKKLTGAYKNRANNKQRHWPFIKQFKRQVIDWNLTYTQEDFCGCLGDSKCCCHDWCSQQAPYLLLNCLLRNCRRLLELSKHKCFWATSGTIPRRCISAVRVSY